MIRYSINKNAQSNGDHEIHKEGCSYEPSFYNKDDLGYHPNDHSALQEGRRRYGDSADGCVHCCPLIHRR